MAQRTFAPQFARKLQGVVRYYQKHQTKIQAVATSQQNTDAATIVAAIMNSWNSVQTIEEP